MPPRLPVVIGILAWCFLDLTHARASTRVRLPMPTSETIPYVAEVMGATSYEESIEEVGGKVKRVQRKLTGLEHKEPDLDQEEQYAEYQGVIGRPGVDFPVLPSIPRTDFSCRKVKSSGYYADLETGCQVFHICDGGRKISFLCPNGTIFRQSHLICDWWFRVDCERSVEQYEESAEQLAHDQMIYRKRAEEIAQAMAVKSGVSTAAPTRPSTSVSYDQRQQRRKPQQQSQQQAQQQALQQAQQQAKQQVQQDQESSELERQIPAETASFASNRHRFGNQIENQYRQYLSSTSTASSIAYNNGQQNYEYNTEQYREPAQNNFDRQRNYEKNQNNYSNANSNSGSIKNKNNFQTASSNNFPSNNYPSAAGNNYQSNSNSYTTSANNNYPSANNYPNSGNVDYPETNNYNNFPTSTNRNYPDVKNNYASSTISNYPSGNNNNYATSTKRNYPSVNNNNYPESINNNYPIANNNNYNYSSANNFPASTNSNYPNVNNYPTSTNRNYPTGNNYPASTNRENPIVNNNYQTSTYRNIPNTNNNYPTTSSYKYENKEYLASNNYPNRNYSYNIPATNTENQSFTVTNYSITTNVNKYSQGNSKNNYPNRGNTNYFSSNNNYNPNPSSTTTIKSPVYSGSPDIIAAYNFSSTEKGSLFASQNEKYREYSKSEALSERGRVKSNLNNDYTPTASTTVRPVTNKIYNEQTPRYEKYTSSGIKQKPIFNVKIKPTKGTKDFAYVELLRHEEKMRNSQRFTSESPIYSSSLSPSSQSTSLNPSSQETIQQTVAVSQSINTLPPTEPPTSSRNTYLPKQTTTTTQKAEVKITPVTNRYASINVSGTSEEIRPEVVNALMESGVTPTSAKALHSLASYISSGAAERDYTNVYDDKNHPHVSDVVLNFHSGSPVTTAYSSSEGTTSPPLTSSGEELPSVLTKATKESYSYLFSESKEEQTDVGKDELKTLEDTVTISPKPITTAKPSTTTTKPISSTSQKPRTTPQSSQNVKGSSNKQEAKGDLKIKDSTELRELAQVFSRALSAYLEDPETFKEILAQVRPTEPNFDNTTPSIEDEVLDFSDAMLGRLGTTVSPVTTIENSDYTDDNINIGEINSLASAIKTFEPDNSLELNTFPPTAPEANTDSRYSSSAPPKLLLFKANTLLNNTEISEYYSKLGSAEDQSYFPTLGGVSDTSRPRYGGFQNNTGKTPKPYGSDVPKNITGTPLSSSPTTTISDESVSTETYNASSTVQNVPEPRDVNSLIKTNVLNSDRGSSEELFDTYQTSPSFVEQDSFYPSGEQEKVLITSGSQSLVSSNNYVQFAKTFNDQAQLKEKEQTKGSYKPKASEQSLDSTKQEDLSPYFGQEPPLENLAVPSGFKSPSLIILNEETSPQKNNTNKKFFSDSDPINYHIGAINEELATPSPLLLSSRDYDVSYNDFSTGFGVSSEEYKSPTSSVSYDQPTWTVSPLYDVTSAGTSLQFNYTKKPSFPSAHHSSPKFQPTTYHPPHSSESSEITDSHWESTYQTENNPSEETTPAYDLNGAGTTLSFDDQYKNFEEAAKEMFGMLNETASAKLMDMMAKGESNMTIRRLVLLLVNDKARENKTAQESRESLINALLTNIDETPDTTLPPQIVTTTTTTQAPRKKVRVSRIRTSTTAAPSRNDQRSGKFYRGTDSMTAVYGSVSSPSDINKINSAKLYIPSPSSAPLTSKLPLDSDARAVELLKTLYSLAAKWG